MRVEDFDYKLPEEQIARYPARTRTGSKLLVYDRSSGVIDHRRFGSLVDYLGESDLLVVNNSRVIKARLIGSKDKTGGEVEFLCLHAVSGNVWRVLCRPARRIRKGTLVHFGQHTAEVVEEFPGGERLAEFSIDPLEVCREVGEMPLPPYLRRKAEKSDLKRYQTVYSSSDGSVAAPTAGLHFSRDLMSEISNKGVSVVEVTLHVGWGTFRPVTAEEVRDHRVEEEWYSIDSATADAIRIARNAGRRIFVVGTTTTRALESWWLATSGRLTPFSGITDLFIYPPYDFNLVDKLVTNFHLPKSSLLMLVSAFAGRENILSCYREAVERKYRFYSYGDAMLLL